MIVTISLATGKPYDFQRVREVLDLPRSPFYARKKRLSAVAHTPAKRGPKSCISDENLLALIRDDLKESPFIGEGHRKVWARPRFIKDHKVSRATRSGASWCYASCEKNLLSPYRVSQRVPTPHDGKIVTSAPNVMCGTDGTNVFTLDDDLDLYRHRALER